MANDANKLEDIINVGIGAVKTSQEVWDKLMSNLTNKKDQLAGSFEKYKNEGEQDYSDNALKVKIGAAWGIVKFDEIKENIEGLLNKEKDKKKS
ncbi:MAG: hypothetical protein O9346_09990 [Leptospiraceae bacterium]|nr:hypothetical protein [Leptospiraceae bacterium]MCZ8237856.1 hypothetical protein [Leptospiraceae bacterium]MCZ8346735.1 hypothetical protein [Leptospiraceae bacterium]PJE03347.1 MAG: hypothetical protein CK427_04865 [Leptospira sp.]